MPTQVRLHQHLVLGQLKPALDQADVEGGRSKAAFVMTPMSVTLAQAPW